MKRYNVEVIETVYIRRSKCFDANTEGEAQDLAEAEDWSEWGVDYQDTRCEIDCIGRVLHDSRGAL